MTNEDELLVLQINEAWQRLPTHILDRIYNITGWNKQECVQVLSSWKQADLRLLLQAIKQASFENKYNFKLN